MERKTNTTFIHDVVMIKISHLIEKEKAEKELVFNDIISITIFLLASMIKTNIWFWFQ